ncbi:P-loop NTPase fold protein [Ewingella americana]|uniref:KAP NTPase domain-containing protein n=1 Tax=Ewingella americana TaxID=41202 RepID=A0A502GI33_9GAMM|nr:P-loop NTPase fold protein [Ewingella americana]TPG61524.1 hypothetical protein EAH77_12850 [Ewingella americana]
MDNITQFKAYINYYKELKSPGFAVLITGEWGSGKTHQITHTLNKDEYYYISLFDITTVEDIYAAVFYKMSPVKAFSRGAAGSLEDSTLGIDSMTFGLGKLFGKIATAIIKEEIKNDRVIIFDDIERCSVHIDAILGVINKYVEHHDCNVIAIAHDEKIKDTFDDSKEKVIGQTLKIEPNTSEIFNYFIAADYEGKIPSEIQNHILNTFIASDCRSMRILKHTIKDAFRLFECIKKEHITNSPAMCEIFTFFTALSIGYRYGKLKENDMSFRSETAIKYYLNKEKNETVLPAIIQLNNVYKKNGLTLDLSRNILRDETIINCFAKGYYDQVEISQDVEANEHLSNGKVEPWIKLMNFDRYIPEDVNDAIQDIDEQLRTLSVVEDGKILHIFNLKLLMVLIKVDPRSYKDIYDQFQNYLNKLLFNNLIGAYDPDSRFSRFRESSFGYGYWIKNEYKEISNKMFEFTDHIKKMAHQKNYPSYIREILDALENDPSRFKSLISSGYIGEGKYAYIDIMKYIRPHKFVEKWLNSPIINWQTIWEGLEGRYSTGMLLNQLSGEKIWISRVNFLLMNYAKHQSGFDRLRIERLVCRPR